MGFYISSLYDDHFARPVIKGVFGNRHNWERYVYHVEWLESQLVLGTVANA